MPRIMLRGIASAVLLGLVVAEASADVPEVGTLVILGLCLVGLALANTGSPVNDTSKPTEPKRKR